MNNPIIYVTRDIERALGIEPSPSYFIVANDGEYARTIKGKHPDFVMLIESPIPLDTFEILEKEETAAFLEKVSGKSAPAIIVFKNTIQIEEICAKKGWRLLNPSAALGEKIENKMTQVEWLGELASMPAGRHGLLPSFKILPAREIVWEKKPLMLQFAHAHTGQGTVLVNNEAELNQIKEKFPDRPTKASEYIYGPTFTVNVVVGSGKCPACRPACRQTGQAGKVESGKEKLENDAPAHNDSSAATQDESPPTGGFRSPLRGRKSALALVGGAVQKDIVIGNTSYQITGMPPLTDIAWSTVGNDWSLPHTILNQRHLDELRDIAHKVGEKMQTSGWRGLFGIDVIYDTERDELKLIEINARQPASTTFESQLQDKFREQGIDGSTIFEAHLAALTGFSLPKEIIEINDGAQLVQRVTKNVAEVYPSTKIAALHAAGYTTIPYSNTKLNADLLRIQSARGFMESHGKWNARGKEICDILES